MLNIFNDRKLLNCSFSLNFRCWCGCCFIPCCMDSMSVFTHSCPNCKKILGKYKGSASLAWNKHILKQCAQKISMEKKKPEIEMKKYLDNCQLLYHSWLLKSLPIFINVLSVYFYYICKKFTWINCNVIICLLNMPRWCHTFIIRGPALWNNVTRYVLHVLLILMKINMSKCTWRIVQPLIYLEWFTHHFKTSENKPLLILSVFQLSLAG